MFKKRKIIIIGLVILIISPLLFLFIKNIQAAAVSWDGGAGTSNWEDAANWSNDEVPTAADDVVIDDNVTVNINSSTTINSLALGNSGGTTSPTLNFNYDALAGEGDPLVIDGDGVEGDALTVHSGATITHSAATSGETVNGRVSIEIQTGNADIAGTINTNERGYIHEEGPGAGGTAPRNKNGGGGGAYGGNGGDGRGEFTRDNNGQGGYGSIQAPVSLGSGGGDSAVGDNGGKGGGSAKLDVAGALTISGSVVANGGSGGVSYEDATGGGSGGSIYLIADTVTGGGTIRADGGTGTTDNSWGYGGKACGGGGGGGRISLEYNTNNFSGTLEAIGSAGGYSSNYTDGQYGGGGSVHQKLASQTNGSVTFDNGGNSGAMSMLESGTFYDLNIQNGAVITCRENTTAKTYYIDLVVENDLTLASGSSIHASETGLIHETGAGAGTQAPRSKSGGGGAGYGGQGGQGMGQYTGAAGGGTYGNLLMPTLLGSGGGDSAVGDDGGNGAGSIELDVSGTLTIDGLIVTTGQIGNVSYEDAAGGGSGGSIHLTADTVAGSGTVRANGGPGATDNSWGYGGKACGGGGGGGRVAVVSRTSSFSGTLEALGGAGGYSSSYTDGEDGYPGSTILITSPEQYEADGATVIPTGAIITDTLPVFELTIEEGESGDYFIEVELRKIGTAFQDSATHTGSSINYSGSPVSTQVALSELPLGDYHWQARICDASSPTNCSVWLSYGGNAEDAIDFTLKETFRFGGVNMGGLRMGIE